MASNPWQDTIPRTDVYPCLSPCDGCKNPIGWWCGWLKISKLAWGFSDGHSIYGSLETSCIYRKGFIMVFVLWLTGPIRPIRLIRGRKREEFIGKDEQAINHLHFHTFCIKMAAARQETSKLAFLHSPCTLFPQNPYTIQINALSLHR